MSEEVDLGDCALAKRQGFSTLGVMALTVELPDDVIRRLTAVAASRGVSIEELAAQTLAQIPTVDNAFAATVTATIGEHRDILERLAET